MGFKKLCLVLGSGLGLGLVTYSLYRLIQRLTEEEEDNNWFGGHKGSGEVIKVPMRDPSRYIRVPVHLMPRLIGTKGERIKEMEANTQTQIHFDNDVLGLED